MSNSTFSILNRIVYIGFGLLLGMQLLHFWNYPNEHAVATEKPSDAFYASEGDKSLSNTSSSFDSDIARAPSNSITLQADDKQLIEKVIRDEIRIQLSKMASESSSQSNHLAQNKLSASSNSPVNQSSNPATEISPPGEQQIKSFDIANQIIDDAISSNQWDTAIAKQLIDQFHSMTVAQELEVRTKFANAVNEGWITPDMPLDLAQAEP
ncbi:MAG: hypothetical protein OQK04_01695 [Kangiellaceae bacterium]|nr:hypothetical protein [Kangiellaceae bacterium]MCW8997416.1 hypothetical protein [Kangiellaceae bacterium]